ncbi:aminodeoxychorismate synthase component I [Thiomicrorhabdus chilensis]|uniref:aminodeoxychorismate synthase component I n=1 Tax=Thiomicrorhabdus chilensis TaxID=63656 RepID=UPI000421C39F|nr:aminodeoxychorismate synthase component I [Thiomicrorhabdus chilensis]
MDRSQSIKTQQAVHIQPVCVSENQHLDLATLHQLHPQRYPFLLESVAQGVLGQYDILFAFPQEVIRLEDVADIVRFQSEVKQTFSDMKLTETDCHLPFYGGWFAYFSYDYAQAIEPSLDLPSSQFPLANLTRVPTAVVVNHQTAEVQIVAEPEFAHLIPQIQADIESALTTPVNERAIQIQNAQEEPEQKYLEGVKAIKEYILSGDIFQVNLSRLWQVELAEKSNYVDVYRALRTHNPAPFAALAYFDEQQPWSIISSSPERLVKYQPPWVETRPIAGTRKRSDDLATDQALIDELISHPKERAEHIMLIDLERNDLGRICQPGTVEVNELMVVETYEHVHHIVSNVRGQLQDGYDPLDIVHALFPGGTITGCPKVRCMEIIAELEQMPREAYTGSLGYINRDGSLDLNILIRTMVHSQQGEQSIVQFRAGAGIVADSDPQHELTETRHKAKGLIRALRSQEALD